MQNPLENNLAPIAYNLLAPGWYGDKFFVEWLVLPDPVDKTYEKTVAGWAINTGSSYIEKVSGRMRVSPLDTDVFFETPEAAADYFAKWLVTNPTRLAYRERFQAELAAKRQKRNG